MAIECRAKNPTTCRVHGSSLANELQAKADQAAQSGNIEAYMSLRQQIDEAHELRNLLEEEAPHADRKVEDAASEWFERFGGGRKWSNESPETREEYRQSAEKCLAAAKPYMKDGEITPQAIDAVARGVYIKTYGYEALENQDEPDMFDSAHDPISSPYYKEIAKTMLYAAKYGRP